MDESLDTWFAREVLMHDGALTRFLHRYWRDHDEVSDRRETVCIRGYKAAAKRRPDSPKPFRFTTARNLLADRTPRKRIVPILEVA